MKTVIENKVETIIKNSKFITLFYSVDSIECVNEKINEAKSLYKDATHYCYAYIIGNNEKANDDGEPTGTAGIPILNVLKKEELNNVLCIVIRYFGGIKLGASGLIRAYSKACKNGLKMIQLKKGYLIEITFNYDDIKQIDYLLKNSEIINKEFKEIIKYKFKITEENYNNIVDNIKDKNMIIEEIYF